MYTKVYYSEGSDLMIMKEEFRALSLEDQVKLVNWYLIQDKSIVDIFKREKLIEADETSVRKKFVKNGYRHDKQLNQYVKCEQVEVHKNITKVHSSKEVHNSTQKVHKEIEPKDVDKKLVHKESTNVYMNQEILELVKNQQVWQQRMSEMWDWYSKQKNVVEPIELKISREKFGSEVAAKTFRVHKSVLLEFLQFSDEHGEYKQQDLVSQALLEFIQKYRR